jgi:hypothetical protein
MSYNRRFWAFIIGLFTSAIAYWASTFSGLILPESRVVSFGVFLVGYGMVMVYAFLNKSEFSNLEKRIAILEGDPELPAKPVK